MKKLKFYIFCRWRSTDEPIKMLDRKSCHHCLNKVIYIIIIFTKFVIIPRLQACPAPDYVWSVNNKISEFDDILSLL